MKDYKNNPQALFDDLGKSESIELEWALTHLYEELYYPVRDYIKKNSGSEEDARSILTEGLTVLHYKRRQGKLENKNLYGMLMKICQFKWLNVLNRTKKLVLVVDEEESSVQRVMTDTLDASDNVLERENLFACIREKLQRLRDKKREIVMDKYFGELSIKEIAEKYKTTVGNITNILFRTRAELRALIIDCPGLAI